MPLYLMLEGLGEVPARGQHYLSTRHAGIIGVRRPICIGFDFLAGALVDLAQGQLTHGDAALDRTDIDA